MLLSYKERMTDMERLKALKRLKGLKESYYYCPTEEYKTHWISKKGVVSTSWGYYDNYKIITEDK
jgi:hypothetical protein